MKRSIPLGILERLPNVLGAVSAAVIASVVAAAPAAEPQRPNMILIMADDR